MVSCQNDLSFAAARKWNFNIASFFSPLQISFNPQDNTQICVIGDGIFKLFRYSEGNLKQFAFQKTEPQNYLSHAWISDERVIVGTNNGRLYIFEAGELKSEMSLSFQQREGET